MQALLASLIVSMGIDDGAYKAGMSAARAEAKKTQQDMDRSADGMASSFQRTARQVNQYAVEIADSVARTAQKVRNAGLALTAGLTIGTVGLGKAAKDAASDFQAQMNRVHSAMVGASADQLTALRDAALTLGPAYGKSAVEAGSAIESLAKNGMNAADILNGGLAAALKLGVLGETELGSAADATTDILQQFHLSTAQLPETINKISGALDASKLSFDGYKDAIGQVGGIAGGLGYSFDDMNTALAAVIPLMTGGSDAGTSFKTFLLSLIPQSKEASGVMEKLGISFRKADGDMMSLAEVAETLNTKLAKYSRASKQDALTKMFGTDGMRVALALMQAGAKGIADVQRQIDGASADQKVAILMEGEAASTQRLSSAWEHLKIVIGDAGLIQAFTWIKNGIASIIEAAASAPRWLYGMVIALGAIVALAGPIIVLTTVAAKFGVAMFAARVVTTGLGGALGYLGVAFAAVVNPGGLVIRLLGQLALKVGVGTVVAALGARMVGLASGIGLVITALSILIPLLTEKTEAGEQEQKAQDDANRASGDAVTMAQQLAVATGNAKRELLSKAKADQVAAAAAIRTARANLAAARAESARARQASGSPLQKGYELLSAGSSGWERKVDQKVAGWLGLPITKPRMQAAKDQQAAAETLGTRINSFDTIEAAITAAEAPSKPLIDVSFDDPKKKKTKKGRDAAKDEANYLDELGRSRVERLQAEADLTGSVRARYTADVAALDEERASYVRQNEVDKGLNDAERSALLAAKDAALERRRDVVQQQLTIGLAQESYDLAKARNDIAQDEVRAAIDAADSVAGRRDGELRLLDLQRQQEEADLDLILATKATSSAEWANAMRRKEALPALYDQRRAASLRGNETPAQAFTRQLNRSGDAMREGLEDAGVSALRDLNSELSDAILGAKNLGDAFANMGKRIIGSLLDIAIQQTLIKPLARSLFGENGSSGWLSSIGSMFMPRGGGGRATGGGIRADRWYTVGERGPERFYPGISGTVVPNDGRGAGPGASGIAQIVPSPYFDAVVDGRVVRGAMPIAQATTSAGMQSAGRASSWRARQTVS